MANIPRAQIDAMFSGMREQARWNTEGELLWGYFSPDSLIARNAELNDIAAMHDANYDGMDVGPLEPGQGRGEPKKPWGRFW